MDSTPDTFVNLLTDLGFELESGRTPVKARRSSGSALQPKSSIKRYTPFRTAGSKFAAWKQPRNLRMLRLDTEALRSVLENGERHSIEPSMTCHFEPVSLLANLQDPKDSVQILMYEVSSSSVIALEFHLLGLLSLPQIDKEGPQQANLQNRLPQASSLHGAAAALNCSSVCSLGISFKVGENNGTLDLNICIPSSTPL